MRTKRIPNPLTPEQHAEFDTFMQTWQKRLGLTGWRVVRSRKKTKHMAQVELDNGAKLAAYRVGDFGSEPTTSTNIEKTALHELLHVLLYQLVYQTENGLSMETVLAEEHSIINTLEKLLIQ